MYVLIETYLYLYEHEKYENVIIDLLEVFSTKYGHSIVFLPFQKDSGGEVQGEYFKSLCHNTESFNLYDINKKGFPEIRDVYSLIKNASNNTCVYFTNLPYISQVNIFH